MEVLKNHIDLEKSKKELVLRYGEFFSGPGGLGLGAHKAKVKIDVSKRN